MTSVLGLPLEQAKQILSQEGIQVTCIEVRSRKGVVDGTQSRVVRQTNLDANHASLLYAVFRTEPNEAKA